MRLVTWNCCRGPATKLSLLAPLEASVSVVQECPRPAVDSPDCRWFGDNPRQGVAVLASSEYRVEPVATRPTPRYAKPFLVTGPRTFLLVAVWAQQDREFPYVKGLIQSVEAYRDLIAAQPTVVMGDFNSNAIWNRKRVGARDHSALVTLLGELGLVSAYHEFHDEAHGAESRPTLYFLRSEARPYHIDYCFIPKAWTRQLRTVEVGSYADWAGSSDHRPLVVDIEDSLTP